MVQCIGFDVHSKQTVACVYNPVDQTEHYEVLPTEEEALAAFLRSQPVKSRLALEVNGMAGRLCDALRPLVTDLQVANPSLTPWIFRTATKTDRLDAKKLAVLMSVGQLPTVHMPRKEIREWRALIQHRRRLLERRTQVKNRIRALLLNEGLRKEHPGCWWTQRNVRWIRSCVEQLSCSRARALEDLLDQLALYERQVKRVTVQLDKQGHEHSGVCLLMTIPGIGPRTAEAVVAYADEVARFARSREFAAYFGVTPKLDESAECRRIGRISKRGPSVVRWLIVEAAWRAIRRSPGLRRFHERVMHGQKGRKKIATVAVARKLLVIMFAMLSTGEEFNEALVGNANWLNQGQ